MKVLPSNGRAVIGIIIVDGGQLIRPLRYTMTLLVMVLGNCWLDHIVETAVTGT